MKRGEWSRALQRWGETPSSPNFFPLEIRARRSLAPPDSWRASFRFCARIGTMNQIGTPLPALSPQGGERVAEGRERGSSWKRKWVRWK